ncbi:MAG TPA: lipoprotein [Ideonella sp.]|nr:lipoprotein [Ideonella sp.]
MVGKLGGMQERTRISVVAPAWRKRVVGMAALLGCWGALALAGCGQRGPLVLPDAQAKKSTPHRGSSPATTPASAPAAAPSGAQTTTTP